MESAITCRNLPRTFPERASFFKASAIVGLKLSGSWNGRGSLGSCFFLDIGVVDTGSLITAAGSNFIFLATDDCYKTKVAKKI